MNAQITFKPLNVSDPAPTPVTPATKANFDIFYADEIALHARVTAQGGHLLTPA